MIYPGHPNQYWASTTYAQHGDDLFVLNLCHLMDIKAPTWLDLGAHHPFDISNTALMYSRGLRGVNIEANPNLMEAFKIHRPEDVNVCIGVGAQPGILDFHMVHPTSGCNSLCPVGLASIGMKAVEITSLTCVTVNYLVETYCKNKVFPDILFTDLEWIDGEVLRSIEWSSRPKIICTEIHRGNEKGIVEYMQTQNFKLLCRIAVNLIFIDGDHLEKCF